jgi:hypothetical protein
MWVAFTVDIFIMTSITVSYITVGTGLQHVLDGMAANMRPGALPRVALSWFDRVRSKIYTMHIRWKKAALYVIFFGGVFAVAFSNPESFLIVMERVTSLALNLEAGAFVVFMLWQSRKLSGNTSPIPMALPDWVYALRWAVLGYFAFACLYDFAAIITEKIGVDLL